MGKFNPAQSETENYRCINLSNLFILEKNPSQVEFEITAVDGSCMIDHRLKIISYTVPNNYFLHKRQKFIV